MSRTKSMFQKASSLAVIIYFFYFLLIKVEDEIASFYKEISGFFWFIIRGNEIAIVFYSIIISFIAFCLVLWIMQDDAGKETIDKAKQQKKWNNKR